MRKKVMTAIAGMALAVTTLGSVAFATEVGDIVAVDNIANLEAGVYKVDAELDCFLNAMGGCQMGAVLSGATLEVAADGTAEMTLTFPAVTNVAMMYGNMELYVNETNQTDTAVDTGYYADSVCKDAEYTTAKATGSDGAEYTYVSTMTFPVNTVADTYAVALNIGGTQFGGDSAYVTSSGQVLAATLKVTWANTEVVSIAEVSTEKQTEAEKETNAEAETESKTTETESSTEAQTTTASAEKNTTPKTGDVSKAALLLATAALAGVVVTASVVAKREETK